MVSLKWFTTYILRSTQKFASGRLITLLGIFLFTTPCVAQVGSSTELSRDSLYRHISRERSADAAFHFSYPQGSGEIRSDLGGNAAELDRLGAFIRQAVAHPELTIGRIYLTGYSSVEGDYARNEFLSRDRVEQFYHYLRAYYPDLYRYPYNLAWVAEDWDGLARMVRRSNLNEREEIIEIIRKVRIYDDREALLMRLNGGRAYREMEKNMFAKLRRVELKVEYTEQTTAASPQPSPREREKANTTATPDPLVYNVLDEPVVDMRDNRSLALANERRMPAGWEYMIKRRRRSSNRVGVPARQNSANHSWSSSNHLWSNEATFALKTNLLLWAGVQSDLNHTTVLPNVALEYYITRNWSIELGARYSYWRYSSNSKFQGISGYRIESRYRFPVVGDRLWGYLGPYFRIGDYDLRTSRAAISLSFGEGRGEAFWGETFTGDYYDFGLSAGLTIRLYRALGLEIGARAGYVKSDIIHYTKDGEYNWYDSTEPYSKVKITDLNISLIYLFK